MIQTIFWNCTKKAITLASHLQDSYSYKYIYCLNILEHMRIFTSWMVHVVFPCFSYSDETMVHFFPLKKTYPFRFSPAPPLGVGPTLPSEPVGSPSISTTCVPTVQPPMLRSKHIQAPAWKAPVEGDISVLLLSQNLGKFARRKPITFKHLKGHFQLVSNDCWRTLVDGGW